VKAVTDKLDTLYVAEVDNIIADAGNMTVSELNTAKGKIMEMNIPEDIKTRATGKIDKNITQISEKEIQAMIGNISVLTDKQASDILRKITMMKADEKMTSKYIERLEAHIIKLREEDAKEFIDVIAASMKEGGLTNAQIIVSGAALFAGKVDNAASEYASVGRFEVPLIVSDNSKTNEAMLLTTEFLYMRTKTGTINRIKVDDIDIIKFEKSFIGNQKIVCKAKNETVEIPNGFDKKSAEAASIVILDVILAIKDKHAAEKMKAIEEANARRQAAAQAAALEEQKLISGTGKDTAPKRVIRNPADTDKHGVEVDLSDVGADLEAIFADLEKKKAFDASKSENNADFNPDDGGFVAVNSTDMNEAATGADALEDQSVAAPANNEYFDGIEVPNVDDMDALPDKADTISDFEIADDIAEPAAEPVAEAPVVEVAAEKTEAPHPKFCPECGSKIDRAGAKFCMECGAKLN
jgi:hypothetical protein